MTQVMKNRICFFYEDHPEVFVGVAVLAALLLVGAVARMI